MPKGLGDGDVVAIAEHAGEDIAVVEALGQHQGYELGLFFGGHLGNGLGRSHGARVVDSSFDGNWNLAHWGLVGNMKASFVIFCFLE
jgi:hypothetical protein